MYRLSATLLIMTLLLAAFAVQLHAQTVQTAQTATVLNAANLRSGPGTSFAVSGRARAGDTVRIAGANEAGDWYRLDNGQWIAAFLVEVDDAPPAAAAEPYAIVTWNLGLDDSDLETVADRIADFEGVDLWGLQEVNSRSAPPILATAAGEGENADFAAIQGNAGDGLHLVALYNDDRFDLLDWWEVDEINTTGNVRPALVLYLEETATGQQFLFMVNHLYRSRNGERHEQARRLNAWSAAQEFPTIAVGDYNFDWDVKNGTQTHDLGYDLLSAGGEWQWVQPETLTTTQCSGWPCRYTSVLDFVFLSRTAQAWSARSEIVVTPGDFPDDETTPDHRPVYAEVAPGAAPTAVRPTPRPSPTPAPTGAVTSDVANLRSGPGTGFAVVDRLPSGQALTVVGRNEVGDWLQLGDGSWIAAFLVSNAPTGLSVVASPLPPSPEPATRGETVTVPPAAQPGAGCDPSYPDVCIPPYPPDLDCGDISYRRFTVIGEDLHGFDGDSDGIGCESR